MNITDAEFRYLKESLAKDLVALLMERRGIDMEQAFGLYFNSKTYQYINTPETGLYYQSPGYLYSFLEDELNGSK